MPLQHSVVAREIGLLVASPGPLGDAMQRVIDVCEGDVPHADWQRLRAIDFDAEVQRLRAWFEQLLASEPPRETIRGFFFDVCQPTLPGGLVTADIHLVGTSEYDPADPELRWLFSGTYDPELYAQSRALDELYGIAYGTHASDEQIEGVLGNDAEWPLGLAFGVLAAAAVMEGRRVDELPADAERVGVAAGFGDGDILVVGEVDRGGFHRRPAS